MNIRVLLAFVVGVVIASGVAFFAARKSQEPVPAASTVAAPATTPVQAPSAEPVAQQTPPAPVPAETKPSPAVTRRETPRHVARNREPLHTSTAAQPPASPAPAPVAAQTPPPQQQPAPAPVSEAPPMPQVAPPPPRQPHTVTIPAGTLLNVRLGEGLSSDRNSPGDSFTATLDQPLVIDGFVIAERGARVEGRVVESQKAGRVKGLSDLAIELVRLNTADGQKVHLQTETFTKQGEKEVGKDVAKVGAAAGIGAAIGAIAGGGKGAGIGAAIGGAAGTGGVMATRGKPAELKVETKLSFRLRDAVPVTEKLK